jgi:hypothetical protein
MGVTSIGMKGNSFNTPAEEGRWIAIRVKSWTQRLAILKGLLRWSFNTFQRLYKETGERCTC